MDELLSFYQADVNLAVTQAGALIAQDLEEKYDMPYLAGLPIGEFGTEHYFACLEKVFENGKSMEVSQKSINVQGNKTGEAVVLEDGIIASSMRVELLAQGYERVRVVSLFGKDSGMSDVEAEYTEDEDMILAAVNAESCSFVAGDPLLLKYRECTEGVEMVELPKYAISSKLYHYKRRVYIANKFMS